MFFNCKLSQIDMTKYNERKLILLDTFVQKVEQVKDQAVVGKASTLHFKVTVEAFNLLDALDRLNNMSEEVD